MPTTDEPGLEALSADECRRLLTSVPLGRLAFTVGALPTIQPMHFTVRGDEVLIPARRGGKVEAASRGAVLAFEVDEYDASARSGWSVTVVGPSRVLTDAAEVTALHQGVLPSWVPAADACVVAVRIARMSGRRVIPTRPTSADVVMPPVRVTGELAQS